jgi:hypothetical protein
MSSDNDYLQRLPHLVGREREKNEALEAIHVADRDSITALYIEGGPGIGKTRLLEEIPHWVVESNVLSAQIVDFYDTAMHSYGAVEHVLADNLGRERFQEFWKAESTFRQQIGSGISYEVLEKQRLEVWEAFKNSYNRLATGEEIERIVLRFDTIERLESSREAPDVIEDCEVKLVEPPVWDWLLSHLPELKNTTVFIAGRPNDRIRTALEEAYGSSFQFLPLGGLARQEVKAYIEASIEGGLEDDIVDSIHILTSGRPILISLAIDWWSHGIWDDALYPLDPIELEVKCKRAEQEKSLGQEGSAWDEWQEIQKKFEIALVRRFRRLQQPQDKAVFCASLARKGCNAELLAHMMDISLTEAQRLDSTTRCMIWWSVTWA